MGDLMIVSLFIFLGCLLLAALTQRWWKSYLNPVTWGVLAWMPALVMLGWAPMFVSPIYIHQNRPLSFLVFVAMGLGFASFWAGCALVKTLSAPDAFQLRREPPSLPSNLMRLFAVFALGLGIFIYAYLNSGLTEIAEMDTRQVAESRLAFHVGPISFLVLFMDIAAIGFYTRFLQTRRWLNIIPLIVALLAYGATLQKSPVIWILIAGIFISALHPRAFYELFLRRLHTVVGLGLAAVLTAVGLAATNTARGITAVPLTTASSPFLEQFYIYSGATAIKNLSVTLEGYLPADGPTFGAFIIRPLLWNFVDRDIFVSGRYFEGVNTATYLNFGWIDFRWAGFVITPLIIGVLVMLFIRFALSGSLVGLVSGAIAARVVVFSSSTDVMFEATTWYTLVLAFVADYITKFHGPARSRALLTPAERIPAPAALARPADERSPSI